jgi:aspartyl-tRNA(Asn)/glutamyl-tRNA(Gln) amidotransferase subunit A
MSRNRLTVRQAARLLDGGLVTSEQLAGFCHSMAMAGEGIWGLNAYTSLVDREELLDQARQSDGRRGEGKSLSIFDGIPISVKSNMAVKSVPLTAGSRILGMGRSEAHPCGYDADTVKILNQDCGALLVGVTSMDEFGMGSLGNNIPMVDGKGSVTKNPLPYLRNLNLVDNSAEGRLGRVDEDELGLGLLADMIRLPHDKILEHHTRAFEDETDGAIYSAGGSSCGSAASVAHGSALLSLGTDTGGSVRLPSAWCSLVGFKPSYGLLSRHGIVSYASSFDTVGILATSIDCVSLALEKLAQRDNGEESRDSTFSAYPYRYPPTKETQPSLGNESLHGVRIGIPSSFSVRECLPEIREAWSKAAECLEHHGAEIVEISEDGISPDLVQNALSAYYVLVSAEASSNLSRYDGFRYATLSSDSESYAGDIDPELTPLERQYASARSLGFGKEVSRRVLCGTAVLSSDRFHTHYEAAAKLRAVLGKQLSSVLDDDVDLLLVPTALTLPCRLDKGEIDSTAMFANDVMTVCPSLAGLPAVSVPVKIEGESTFMAGLQLIGPRLREDDLLHAGRFLERGITSTNK